MKQSPQLNALIESDTRYKDLMAVAKRLEGLARHASTHAAGVVISPEPLTNIVPLYKSSRDEITTQYDMKGLEHIGLLKMDFLGLTTLTVLDDTVHMIEQNRGKHIDLSIAKPLDDEATLQTLCPRRNDGDLPDLSRTACATFCRRYTSRQGSKTSPRAQRFVPGVPA